MVDFADPAVPLELFSDASDFALGSVLATRIDGALCPIAYYSRKLSDAERNYDATDRELLSVVNSLRHFRHSTVCWDAN